MVRIRKFVEDPCFMSFTTFLKSSFLSLVFCLVAKTSFAQLCVPNPGYTQPGVYPDTVVNMSSGCAGAFYLMDFTLVVPPDTTVFGLTFTVNYMQIDSVGGLPPGMSFVCNPGTCIYPGGTSGCFQVFGTPPASGSFDLTFYIQGSAYNPLTGNVIFPFSYGGYVLNIGNYPILTTGNTSATCNGNNAMAWVSATGSSGNSYYWSTFSTNDTIFNLSAGIYTINVSDTFNCSTLDTVIVNDLGAPQVDTVIATHLLCYGDNNGSATVTVSGGTPGYSYLWNNGDTTVTTSSLIAGTYSIAVSDVNSCQTSALVTITEPSQLFVFETNTDVTCFGYNDGTALATVVGGTGTYDYNWTSGSITANTTGLVANTYTVTVTDDNGCTSTASSLITEPTAIIINIAGFDANCFGGNDGMVTSLASGGTPGYSYSWNNGDTTSTINNLTTGTYIVTVTDSAGCMATDSATVSSPPAIIIGLSGTDESILFASDGTVDATVSGGAPGYTYSWSNSATTQDLTGLPGGTYVVVVTDTNGCTATDSITIQTIPGFGLETNDQPFSIYPNPATDHLFIETATSGPLYIYDITGKEVLKTNLIKGKQILLLSEAPSWGNSGKSMAPGVYFMVFDSKGKKSTAKLIIQ